MKPNEKPGALLSAFKNSGLLNETPPTRLFHYTSANGLKAIVEKNGMYAAPYYSMNDPQEIKHGVEIIETTLCDSNFTCTYPVISEALLSKLHATTLRTDTKFLNLDRDLHLICFSESSDNLSEWRAYADDGNGFAIEIDTYTIARQPDSWGFSKCLYRSDEQIAKLRKLIEVYDAFLTENNLSITNNDLLNICGYLLWTLIIKFKHEAYSDEKEWRFTPPPNKLSKFNAFISGKKLRSSGLIPFKGQNAVKKIIVGPRNDFKTASFAIESMLKDSPFSEHNKPKIVMSEAPYR